MTDFAQTFLIVKIKTYLINHGRQRLADDLSPGYCAGLTVLFLYMVSQGKFEQFKQLLTHLAQWSPESDKIIAERIAKLKLSSSWQTAANKLDDFLTRNPQHNNLSYEKQLDAALEADNLSKIDVETLRQAMLPEDPMIEKLFGLIEWIQRSSDYSKEYSHYADKEVIDVIHDENKPHDFEKILYENSLVLNYKELIKLIENCPEDSPIFLGSFDHAFALYKVNGQYYLYESNFGALPSPTTSAIAIASKLAYDTYHDKKLSEEYPLKLFITSREDNKVILTKLDELLVEIFQTKPRNHCAFDGCSTVLLATKNSQKAVLASRIAQGEDVNLPHICGLYPVHLASQIETMQMLLAAGANINQPIKTTDNLLEKLTQETIVYYRSVEGATPLFVLAGHSKPEFVEWLIQKKADVDSATAIGLTPLMNAAKKGKFENVKMLLKYGANVTPFISNFKASVSHYDTHDNSAMLSYIAGGINTNRFEGYNAAMLAAEFQHTDIAIELLQYGTDPHHQTSEGESLLTIACAKGDARLLQELIKRNVSLTQTKTIFSVGKATPLYLACRHGHKNCVEILLAAGAEIITNDPDGIPPLLGASLSNNPAIIRVLHQHGANIEVSFQNKTPLSWSISRGMVAAAECLMDLGAVITKDEVDFEALTRKDDAQMLEFVMRKIKLSESEQHEVLEKAINDSAVQCVRLLLQNHLLLADASRGNEFIQKSLETSNHLCFAELCAHCLIHQQYPIEFEKLIASIFYISPQKKLIIDYFDLVHRGEPINTILHHLIDDLSFLKPKTKDILHKAVNDTKSIENLIAELLAKSEEIDDRDQVLCDVFFNTVKEVIYQYPPESLPMQSTTQNRTI